MGGEGKVREPRGEVINGKSSCLGIQKGTKRQNSGEVTIVPISQNMTQCMKRLSKPRSTTLRKQKGTVNRELKVLYLNARSVRNKVDELVAQIVTGRYDVVGITETWLQGVQDWQLNIQGFTTYRKDREVGRGGGVALLIRNEIKSIALNDIGSDDVESVWVELRNHKGKKTIMGVMYRPPNSGQDQGHKMHHEIERACQKGKVTVIMGDFNMQVDWVNNVGSGPKEREFIECLQDGFLEQLVMEPTREQAILDLVLCNEPDLIKDLKVREHLGGSDHNMVEFSLQFERRKVESDVKVLQLNKGNYRGMREELTKIDWEQSLVGKTVEQQWQEFLGVIEDTVQRFIPKKRKVIRGGIRQPWLTKEVRECIKAKEKAYNVAKSSGKSEDWEGYKNKQRITKREIRKERIKYEGRLASNIRNDSKSFFKYIKNKREAKVDIGPLQNDAGNLVMGDKEIAEELNKYFASVFTVEDMSNIPTIQERQGAELSMVAITREKVLEKLKGLKIDKSPGPDGLHPRVLKEIAEEIVEALVMIFQKSLESGKVPEDWKIAVVTPLFKKGTRKKMENYRPISLTSVVGKILESIVKDEISKFLEVQGQIRTSQHGFSKGRSCLTNLLEFFEEITNRLDQGEPMDVIYLDFQKAFDKVPHGRLLSKIRAHGIRGKVLTWIDDWLSGRRQRVGIKGSFSKWQPVTSGVPQGSVLGPQLFSLYINDLDDGIGGILAKFADDTKIGGGAGSIEEVGRLQKDLDSLGEWSKKWLMKFNVGKCEVLHFGKKNRGMDYFLNGDKIHNAKVQRDLGVLVQDSLKVNLQVESVIKKANVMLSFISRGLEYKSRDVLLRLYKALVRPHLEYCEQFWAPHLRKDILALERVQRRFTRMIPGMVGLTYDERLRILGLYSLEFRRLRGDLIETYKIMNGLDRVDVGKLFPLAGETRTRGHSLRIKGTHFRTEMRRNFFSQRVVGLWNSLPQRAVEAGTLSVFKTEIDKFLISRGIKGYGERAGKWS